MNYEQAKAELARGRAGTRVLHQNLRTTLREESGAIIMRLVDTDIITWHPDGRIVLRTGDWRTLTTKRRMNDYVDNAVIYQEKNVWYVAIGYDWDHPAPFAEGITLHSDGTITDAANQEDTDARKRLAKQINKYAAAYASALLNCEIPAPSSADCWGCCMSDVKTGKSFMGNDHLISHLDESYYVPSLLALVVKAYPVAPLVKHVIGYIWSGTYCRADVDNHFGYIVGIAHDQIKSSVRKYLRRALGI